MNEYLSVIEVRKAHKMARSMFSLADGRGFVGGSFVAWLTWPKEYKGWKPNDIDIFATSQENAEAIRNDLYKRKYWLNSATEIAYTLRRAGSRDIQVIKPSPEWSDFPNDIVESFDLDICRAVLVDHNKIKCDANAGSMHGKVLRINNPLRTLKRIQKYQVRGVTFTDHELLKVFQAWEASTPERKTEWLDRARFDVTSSDADSGDADYDDDDWWEGE